MKGNAAAVGREIRAAARGRRSALEQQAATEQPYPPEFNPLFDVYERECIRLVRMLITTPPDRLDEVVAQGDCVVSIADVLNQIVDRCIVRPWLAALDLDALTQSEASRASVVEIMQHLSPGERAQLRLAVEHEGVG